MSLVYFIRHGQASFGKADYDALSPLGFRQAEALGQFWADIDLHLDAVFCGTMKRQQQTTEAVLDVFRRAGRKAPEPIVLPAFDEYDAFGIWDAHVADLLTNFPEFRPLVEEARTSRKAFQRLFEKVMIDWAEGKRVHPDEPTWQSVIERVTGGIRTLIEHYSHLKSIAVFTSGGPIGIAIKAALELSATKAMEISWQVLNASVSRFYLGNRGIFLGGFNDVAHLLVQKAPEMITYR